MIFWNLILRKCFRCYKINGIIYNDKWICNNYKNLSYKMKCIIDSDRREREKIKCNKMKCK